MGAGWYGVSFGLLGTAIAIGLTGFNQYNETIEGMQRRLMPGSVEIALASGRTTLYLEEHSIFDGQVVDTPPFDVKCTCIDISGHPAPIGKPADNVRYSIDHFAGPDVADIMIPTPGTYVLACEGSQPYVLAVGAGIGNWKIVGIVGGMVPGIAGLTLGILTVVKRGRWKRRNRA